MMDNKDRLEQNSTPLAVSHVADFFRRYPGETVTLYTRLDVDETLPDLALRITLPAGLALEAYRAPPPYDDRLPIVESIQSETDGIGTGATRLVWNLGKLPPGNYEYQASARVEPMERDATLKSEAVATSAAADGETVSAQETVAVAVSAKGRYLEHMPALYYRDELMGRFLMLFESFWEPIEGQIDNLPFYFDPRFTPPDFLPWLAGWLNLVLDERWPEDSRRLLLRSAALLYRKRGTREGLEAYLEIFCGQKAKIIEHRAYNLRLGPESRLGAGIALGTENVPHTFTVVLRLPPISSPQGEEEGARQELERRRIIEAIIKAEKPAHTSYTLRIKTGQEEGE
jgi:phage tail-like protein